MRASSALDGGAPITPTAGSWGVAHDPPVGDYVPPATAHAGSAGNDEAGFDPWGDAADAVDQSPIWMMTILAAAARARRRRRHGGLSRRNRLTP